MSFSSWMATSVAGHRNRFARRRDQAHKRRAAKTEGSRPWLYQLESLEPRILLSADPLVVESPEGAVLVHEVSEVVSLTPPQDEGQGVPSQNDISNGTDSAQGLTSEEITTPLTLEPIAPFEALIEGIQVQSDFAASSETDTYSAAFDVFNKATVIFKPLDPSIQATITLNDFAGTPIQSQTASFAGQSLSIRSVPINFSGAPALIDVTSLAGAGAYELIILSDATAEIESVSGTSNDTIATAQDLSESLLFGSDLQLFGNRVAVRGEAGPEGDYFLLPNFGGFFLSSIALEGINGGNVSFEVRDANDNLIALGGDGATSADSFIQQLRATPTDDLYIRVLGQGSDEYILTATKSVQLGLEPEAINGVRQQLTTFSTGTLGSLGIGEEGGGVGSGFDEPNDTIFEAVGTNVLETGTYSDSGAIGDNFNLSGNTSLDVDFFEIGFLNIGDIVTINVDDAGLPFGSSIILFNSFGDSIDFSDTFLEFEVFDQFEEDTYYVGVSACGEFDCNEFYDPFSEGSGDDLSYGEGTYDILIEVNGGAGGAGALTSEAVLDNFDVYGLTIFDGDTITIDAQTVDGSIDPRLILIDPITGFTLAMDDNSGGGTSARIVHTITTGTQEYQILVDSITPVPGHYVLTASSSGGNVVKATEIVSDNVSGQTFGSFPRSVLVEFTTSLKVDTVQATDLTVNGMAATAVRFIDGNTLAFDLDVSAFNIGDGTYTVNLPSGSFKGTNDLNVSDSINSTFTFTSVDPPEVIASTVETGDVILPGDLTYTATFSEPIFSAVDVGIFTVIILNENDATLVNTLTGKPYEASNVLFGFDKIPNPDPNISNFSTDFLTLEYDDLPEGAYELRLINFPAGGLGNDGLFDVNGNRLDGSPSFPLPSGDGAYGDDFVVNFFVDGPGVTPIILEDRDPLGSFVADPPILGAFHAAGDIDTFSIDLDQGQLATFVLTPVEFNQRGRVTITDPFGGTFVDETAVAGGKPIVIQAEPTLFGGTYTIDLSSLEGSGAYLFEVILNAALEEEIHTPVSNDTSITAEDTLTGVLPLNNGADRTAIVGRVGAGTHTESITVNGAFEGEKEAQFNFDPGPGANGFVGLTITAFGDLNGSDESLTVSFDGPTPDITLFEGVGFGNPTPSVAQIFLTPTAWEALSLEGTATITTRASGEFTDFVSGNFITIEVSYDVNDPADYYRLSLNAGEAASILLGTVRKSDNVTIELEDNLGNILAIGHDGFLNAHHAISDFIAPTTGDYFVKVSGSGRYNLVTTREASFDFEPNDQVGVAQDLSQTFQVLGNLTNPPATGAGSHPIRVAEIDSNPPGSGDPHLLINQLNNDTFFDFDAVRVTIDQVDTLDELLAFDVVVLGSQGDLRDPVFSSVLRAYVEGGGGLVASAFILDVIGGVAPIVDLDDVIPIDTSATKTLVSNGTIEIQDDTHPVTAGITDFFIGFMESSLGGADPGATVLGTSQGHPTVVVQELGAQGRSVYLGPHYTSNSVVTLRSGLADQLLEQAVAWAGGAGDRFDVFEIQVNEGDQLNIATTTPFDDVGQIENVLDPTLELYDPNGFLVVLDENGAPDAKNAVISYIVPGGAGGTYSVLVRAENFGGGTYTLTVDGATGTSDVVPVVEGTSPSEGQKLALPPTHIDLVLSEGLLVSTVEASDLTIDGGATVDSVQLLDGRTARFFLTVPDIDFIFTYTLADGAFDDLQGNASAPFAGTFEVDKTGPRVIAQLPALQASAPFSAITVVFDEDVLAATFTTDDIVSFTGPGAVDLLNDITGVSGSGDTYTVTFNQQVALGQYSLILGPNIEDVVGLLMDQDQNGVQGEGTDTYTAVVEIQTPDLTVESVVIQEASAEFGNTITVDYTIRNIGTDPALENWSDRIWLSSDTVLGGDTLLLTVDAEAESPLAAGAAYSNTIQVTLPLNDTLFAGTFNILVQTDAFNSQLESSEGNNVASDTIDLTVPPLPDLIVSLVSPPAVGNSGQDIPLTWTIMNQGDGDFTGTFFDQVFLSDDNLIGSDTFFGSFGFTGSILAGQSIQRDQSITVPITTFGSRFVVVKTDTFGQVFEHANEDNNTTISLTPIDIQLPPLADLVVTDISAPSEALSGDVIPITWTVSNQGPGDFTGTFSDRVFLSVDNQVGDDQTFGTFGFTGTILSGQSVERTQSITLPVGLDDPRFVIVTTDINNNVFEDTNDNNNTIVDDISIDVSLSPFPNLQVEFVTPPISAFSGQTAQVDWRVTNVGTGPTNVPQWFDGVYLSTDEFFDGIDIFLGQAPNASFLSPGDSYNNSLTVTIPDGIQGDLFFIIQTDRTSKVFELFGETDNSGVGPSTDITLTPPPDLQVTSVVAPSQAFSGQPFTLSWTVTNEGTGNTIDETWFDQVWMSTDNDLNTSMDTFLGSFSHIGTLDPTESYSVTETVDLPIGVTGPFFFFVQTDAFNQVFEFAFDNNNTGFDDPATTINLTPPPDLVVDFVDAPITAEASHSLTVDYRASNVGSTVTPNTSWQDRLYLSFDEIFDPNEDQFLGSRSHFGALADGGFYDATFTVTLDNGLSGPFFVFVQVDAVDQVFEVDNANNATHDPLAMVIESSPADLFVTSFTAPATAESGTGILVDWTVENQGIGDTAISRWFDRIWISPDNVFGDGNDSFLESGVKHDGLLDVGESYTEDQFLLGIPLTQEPGDYFLFLETDRSNGVFEGAFEINNVSAALPFTVTRDTADLQVTQITPVLAATAGESITVEWTVQNSGLGDTNAFFWFDEVFLSIDQTLSGNDLLLGTQQRTNVLGPGGSYLASKTFNLDTELLGDFFIIVNTDSTSKVFEPNAENNNILPAASPTTISLSSTPDLIITAVDAPASAFSGQPFVVNWTVRNDGPTDTTGFWYESIYLSQDQIFDKKSDRLLGSHFRGGLAAGAERVESQGFRVPLGFAGPFYVFGVVDSSDRVFERDGELNNATYDPTAMQVDLLPLADFVVGTITVPPDTNPGQSASISYTVLNQGLNPALGSWEDSIFLSKDNVWDIDDVLFSRVTHTGAVLAGQDYSETAVGSLPGVLPGDYFVIIRSDIRNHIEEVNETNNISASLDSFNLDVPVLLLNTPTNGSLGQSGSEYFRLDVPAGETLLIDFDSTSATGVNELYVRFGNVPTRSSFDFSFTDALQPDQQVLVPTTEAGTYYIQAFGSSVPVGEEAFTIEASLLSFDVLDSSYRQGGNVGNRTIEINGAKFDRTVTAMLNDGNGFTLPATEYFYVDATRLYATFDLFEVSAGLYDVVVANTSGDSVTVTDGLEVVNGGGGDNEASIISVSRLGTRGGTFSFIVPWGNDGINDAVAPLLFLESTLGFAAAPFGELVEDSQVFYAYSRGDGPSGILLPDQSFSRIFFSIGDGIGSERIAVGRAVDDESAPFDWDIVREGIVRPTEMTDAEFELVFAQMISQAGSTFGDYLAMVSRNANLIPTEVGLLDTPDAMIQLEFDRAHAALTTSIVGRVFSPDFAIDLSGQQIRAVNLDTHATVVTTTLNDGSFIFANLAPVTYQVFYDAALIEGVDSVTLTQGQQAQPVFNLRAGGFLQGTITDGPTGFPIAQATVFVTGFDGRTLSTLTNDDGTYQLPALATGTYTLVAQATDKPATTIKGILVTEGETVNADASLGVGGIVTGTVSLELGEPDRLLIIRADRQGEPPLGSFFAQVEDDLSFNFTGLPPGIYDLTVIRERYVPVTISNVNVTEGGSEDVGDSFMQRAVIMGGQVVSTVPVDPADVGTVSVFENGALVRSVGVDETGNFHVFDLPPSTYMLRAERIGAQSSEVEVTLAVGEAVSNLLIEVGAGSNISGVVTNTITATPLVGIGVILIGTTDGKANYTITDETGAYLFTDLNGGTYTVEVPGVSAGGQSVVVDDINDVTFMADLSVTPVADISGILQASDLSGIASGVVDLYENGLRVSRSLTGPDGAFAFQLLRAGTFELRATAETASFDVVSGIVVNAGESPDFTLTAGQGVLTVTVTDSQESLDGGTITVIKLGANGRELAGIQTLGANGLAQFDNLVDGAYEIKVSGLNNRGGVITVTINGGATVPVNLNLQTLAVVDGAVIDNNGMGVAGARLVLRDAGTEVERFTVSGTDGQYQFTGVLDGTYELVVLVEGFDALIQNGLVVSGDATVDATLVVSTTSLIGRVVDEVSNPVFNAEVLIRDVNGLIVGLATTQADGTFSLTTASGTNLTAAIEARNLLDVELGGLTVTNGISNDLGDVTMTSTALNQDGRLGLIFQGGPEGGVLIPLPLQSGGLGAEVISGLTGANATEPAGFVETLQFLSFPSYFADANNTDLSAADPITADQVPSTNIESCRDACRPLLGKALRDIQFQDRFLETWGESVDQYFSQRNLARAIFAAEFAQNAGLVAAAYLAFNAAAVASATAATGSLASNLAIGNTVGAVVNGLYQLGVAVSSAGSSGTPDGTLAQLDQAGNLLSNLLGLLGTAADAVGNFEGTSPGGVLGILGPIINLQGTLRTLTFTETRNSISAFKSAMEQRDQAAANFEAARHRALKSTTSYITHLKDWIRDELRDTNGDLDPRIDIEVFITYPRSRDPNDILGPEGFGEERWVPFDERLNYTIRFENDPLLADAPAQSIRITTTLDPDVDVRTFRLNDITLSTTVIDVPDNAAFFQDRLDLREDLGIFVDVFAGIDVINGEAFWEFVSVDPLTGDLPIDPLIGLLAVNNASPDGEGFVTYSVLPKADTVTGTRIDAQATIVFDINAPIDTPAIFNTVDATPPDSGVTLEIPGGGGLTADELAAGSSGIPILVDDPQFVINWGGTDDSTGSAIQHFDVFVSDNGGPFLPYLLGTELTGATFAGEVGHTYSFFSQTTDNAGNTEGAPATPDVLIRVRPDFILDIDDDGEISTDTDGQLILRYLFGLRGDALVSGVVDLVNGTRVDSQDIVDYLDSAQNTMLDIDGNGQLNPMTDGLLALRFMSGATGNNLVAGVVDTQGLRTTGFQVNQFFQTFLPAIESGPLTSQALGAVAAPILSPEESVAAPSDAGEAGPALLVAVPNLMLASESPIALADQSFGSEIVSEVSESTPIVIEALPVESRTTLPLALETKKSAAGNEGGPVILPVPPIEIPVPLSSASTIDSVGNDEIFGEVLRPDVKNVPVADETREESRRDTFKESATVSRDRQDRVLNRSFQAKNDRAEVTPTALAGLLATQWANSELSNGGSESFSSRPVQNSQLVDFLLGRKETHSFAHGDHNSHVSFKAEGPTNWLAKDWSKESDVKSHRSGEGVFRPTSWVEEFLVNTPQKISDELLVNVDSQNAEE